MNKNKKSNLKQIIIAGVGGLAFIAVLITGVSIIENRMNFTAVANAQEETKNAVQENRFSLCSDATLTGKYAVIGDGFVPNGPPPAPMVPFANVSLMTLDGAGNLTNKITVSRNGQITQSLDSGTYTVNPDCTGTMAITIPTPPFQLTFNLVVADLQGNQGKEFYFIATTNSVVTHTAKRIQ